MFYTSFFVFLEVDIRTVHGSTPLCNACASGSLECAKLLLEYGANVNPSLTALTASPLHEACIQGNNGSGWSATPPGEPRLLPR